MKEVNTGEFKELIKTSDKPLLVDFWADWCAPCKLIRPILNELANDEELKKKIDFIGVDVEANNELATEYNIRAIPTILLIDPQKGKIMESVGLVPKHILRERIENALNAQNKQ